MLARVALITVIVCAALLLAPQAATLFAQSGIPQFVANGITVVSVTVTLANGQTIVVPITLDFTVENSAWGGKLTVDAQVAQQTGMTISVQDNNPIVAGSIAVGVTPHPTMTPVVVLATPTILPPTVAPVVIVPSPTSVPSPIEMTTVGQWAAASEEDKRAMALLWSQRLSDQGTISGSPELFAAELFDCVDIGIQTTMDTFGESYALLDIAAVCIVAINQ